MSFPVYDKKQYEFMNEIKAINRCLIGCVNHFVEIGFRLQEIRNQESFTLLGYKTFDEFVSTEFNLGSTSVKNYIAVANKFGDKGTLKLKDKFSKYSLSQLVELLPVSEDIDAYTPAMTTKEIRSRKIISQSTDYKKQFLNWINLWFKENQKELEGKYGFSLSIYSYSEYQIVIEPKNCYKHFVIYFFDGYYEFNYGKSIYDLDLESFQKKFKEELYEFLGKMQEMQQEAEASKKKAEDERIAALPENEPGISLMEQIERRQKRLKEEKAETDFKSLKKNKNFNFGFDFYMESTRTFMLFQSINKVILKSYSLIYYPKKYSYQSNFIGLINGVSHFRFYNDRIESYDGDSFETVLTLKELETALRSLMAKAHFGRLFDLETEEKILAYPEDISCVVKALKQKNPKFAIHD